MNMRKKFLKLVAVTVLSAAPYAALAGSHSAANDIRSFDSLEYAPFGEGPVEISVLWGDPTIGPVGFVLRIPAGFETPIHSHTASYHAVVLDGAAQHWFEGEDKDTVEPLTAGGYWAQPGGEVHGDANASEGTSHVLVIFDGPVDFVMAE